MTATILEVLKPFKYDGKTTEPGEEFIPVGGKWDHILTNPEKGYVREVTKTEPEQKLKVKAKPKKKPAVKKDHRRTTAPTRVTVNKKAVEKFPCPDCDRDFETDRGLKVHKSRYCKGV